MTLFHLHVDGHCMSEQNIADVKRIGFIKTPFRMDLGGDGFEAPHHFTIKTTDSKYFKTTFENVISALENSEFVGYVEGECVPTDVDIPFHPGGTTRPILRGTPQIQSLGSGQFRESELHIAFNQSESDLTFRQSLIDLGFFSAFMDKAYGVCEILTIQGTSAAIRQIEPIIVQYLHEWHSLKNCSVKREDIAKFWLSSPDVKRAPVLTHVADLELSSGILPLANA